MSLACLAYSYGHDWQLFALNDRLFKFRKKYIGWLFPCICYAIVCINNSIKDVAYTILELILFIFSLRMYSNASSAKTLGSVLHLPPAITSLNTFLPIFQGRGVWGSSTLNVHPSHREQVPFSPSVRGEG